MTNLKTEVTRKQSTPNFSKNEHFLPPYTHTCAYKEVRNVRFSKSFSVLCFLVTSVLRFALLSYHWQSHLSHQWTSIFCTNKHNLSQHPGAFTLPENTFIWTEKLKHFHNLSNRNKYVMLHLIYDFSKRVCGSFLNLTPRWLFQVLVLAHTITSLSW